MIPTSTRIVFYGTPDIAAYQLEMLVQHGYNVVCAVTIPDKPAGRGQRIGYSSVKISAVMNNIPYLQPEDINSESFRHEILTFSPDLQIVVAFSKLPKHIYSIPLFGTFNLHTSLLPQYRGAAPINRAIMNGETQTGMTTFLLSDKVDCGSIIHNQTIEITPQMTAGELHDKMMEEAHELIFKTIETLVTPNNGFVPTPQPMEGDLKKAPKIFKSDMRIDWTKKGRDIINQIRGLSPYPAAFASFRDRTTDKIYQIKVYSAGFEEKNIDSENVGVMTCTDKDKVEVCCSDGVIQIFDLQLSGKKRMNSEEFLRGFRIRHSLYAETE